MRSPLTPPPPSNLVSSFPSSFPLFSAPLRSSPLLFYSLSLLLRPFASLSPNPLPTFHLISSTLFLSSHLGTHHSSSPSYDPRFSPLLSSPLPSSLSHLLASSSRPSSPLLFPSLISSFILSFFRLSSLLCFAVYLL